MTAAWTGCTAQNLPNPLRVLHHPFLVYLFSLNYCMNRESSNQYEHNSELHEPINRMLVRIKQASKCLV